MQSPFLTSGVNPMTGNLDMGSQRIINLQEPAFSTDGATKNYVDDRSYLFSDRFPPVDMTGLTAPFPFVVSSINSSSSAWYAFAHVDSQDWLCSSAKNSWVQIIGDFRFVLKRLVVRGSFNGRTGTIYEWNLAGFNDVGGNFVVLADQNSPGGGNITLGTRLTILLPNNTLAFSGYRFNCVGGTDDAVSINYIGLYNGISNLDIYGDNLMRGTLNMNNRKITNLFAPAESGDATNKNYVDTVLKKCLNGYIPPLESNTSRLGFIASASGIINNYLPYGAFNSLNADGVNGSWVVGVTTGWLQIQCPEAIIIWRVAIKARAIAGRNITAWNIQGSNDGTVFTNLITSTTTLLGAATAPSFFDISTTTAYSYYRLNITASVGATDVGIQVFQIYTYCQ